MNLRADNRPKIGDVVQLKDVVGPRMIVEDISSDDMVKTVWFDLARRYQSASFPNFLLTKVSTDTSSISREKVLSNPEFKAAMLSGQTIKATKIFSSLTGLGLKDSKDAVDELIESKVW